MEHNQQELTRQEATEASKPRLSICIPTYNRAVLLNETLSHLAHVCGEDVEIVISDNCSSDHTQKVIDVFAPRFRYFHAIRQSENRGAAGNSAAITSLATGKYIYTLCDDDEIFVEGLMAAISIMEENQGIVGVYGGYQEWSRTKGNLSPPLRHVEQRVDFAQGEKLAVFNKFSLLWLPVCRTDIVQRYFNYNDKRTFGMWELVGTLLERGGITLIPDLFYKHAHTEPRMEYELTEAWYHDAYRAQYESFVGRIGPADFATLSNFITARVAPAYKQGIRFAMVKREFLTARHFLLRSRAYKGMYPEADIMKLERQFLVGMVAERLLGQVELFSDIKEVVFEASSLMQGLREHFSAIAPGYIVTQMSSEQWQELGLRLDQYLVTYTYGAPGWDETVNLGPARYRAVEDLIETCRITDQPLGFLESINSNTVASPQPATNNPADGSCQSQENSSSTDNNLVQLGEELFAQNKFTEAAEAFEKAVQRNPADSTAYNNLGAIHWQTGDFQEAEKCFKRAIEINPTFLVAIDNFAAMLETLKQKAPGNLNHDPRLLNEKHEKGTGLFQRDQPLSTQLKDETSLTVKIKGDIEVCVPNSIELLTPYVLLEQEDWFESEMEFVRHMLRPGMQVIDIGANYGLYTLTMAKAVGSEGKVYAFEPAGTTVSYLQQSIRRNQMANVELIQGGLSNREGKAKLCLNPNSELNKLIRQPEKHESYETIRLFRLDDCLAKYGWRDIAFVKLDAEGEESNIIKGGSRFLSSQSPLIMFEVKHGQELNLGLMEEFADYGYETYKLIPGLNLLAPFDLAEPPDPYQLNLFCCKKGRAHTMEEQGLLVNNSPCVSTCPPIDGDLWVRHLGTLPYAEKVIQRWISSSHRSPIAGWENYQEALNYYVCAHSENASPSDRYACLQHSLSILSMLLDTHASFSRLQTLARVTWEMGKRQIALQALDLLADMFRHEQQLSLSEPFLTVASRFEHLDPGSNLGKWCLASILEQRTKLQAFSSYYTGKASLADLEIFKNLGFQGAEMERRRQLIRMRCGMQDGPGYSTVLSLKTKDNLNPEFWGGHE